MMRLLLPCRNTRKADTKVTTARLLATDILTWKPKPVCVLRVPMRGRIRLYLIQAAREPSID